jgi:hypothetical protein
MTNSVSFPFASGGDTRSLELNLVRDELAESERERSTAQLCTASEMAEVRMLLTEAQDELAAERSCSGKARAPHTLAPLTYIFNATHNPDLVHTAHAATIYTCGRPYWTVSYSTPSGGGE